jgi:hypothetical protein
MDRSVLQRLVSKHAKAIEGLKELGRWNEDVFEYDGPDGDLRVHYQYSGFDAIVVKLVELISRESSTPSTNLQRSDIIDDRDEDENSRGDNDNEALIDDNGIDDDEDDGDRSDSDGTKGKLSGVHIESDARILRLQKRLKRGTSVEVEYLAVGTGHPELACSDCHRSFSYEAYRERHVCRGPQLKKDLLSYCTQKAVELYQRGELDVIVAENQI